MISRHGRKQSDYPDFLVALVLGQDGTLCDKIGRVPSEPVLVSVANILNKKRKHHNYWFYLCFIPEYLNTQLNF